MITVFVVTLFLLVIMIVLAVHSAFVYKKALDLNPKVLELQELERRIATANDVLSQLDIDYRNLMDDKSQAEEIIAKGDKARAFLEGHEDQINQMKEFQSDLQDAIDDLEKKREEKNKAYVECQQKYTDINREVDELSIKLDNLNKDIESKTREDHDLDSRINSKRNTEAEIDNILKSKRKERDDLNEECAKYESIKKELADLEKSVSSLRDDKGILEEEIKGLETERDNLKKYHESETELIKKIEALKNDLKIVEDDLTAKREERDNLYKECAGYDSVKKDLEELTGKVEELRSEKADLEKEIKELQKQKDNLLKFSETEEEIRKKIKDAQAKLDELDVQIREKERTLGSFDGKEEELKSIAATLEALKGEKLKLEGDIDFLKSQKEKEAEQDKILKDMESKIWDDLDNRPVFDTKNIIIKKNVSETSMLNEFKNKLNEYEIQFDPRTINAFHTGLKTADSSPLVVLSGISGTGKSLLPHLYASAMGMNFLSVAVQPRWDSPQDMFGFFNYMQSKFKATELSRMLWQYDIYNNTEKENSALNVFKKEGNLPMNIVLFDEMNLARVEYYFSDMLSKLEIRRNINDASKIKSRTPAEIEIEGGSISMKDNARRLYVNKNTLFVGTMNEDETTQSLSDKVMDRSNVLRFGKPKKLDVKPRVPEFLDYYAGRNDYLSYEKWNDMISDNILPSSLEENINSVIDDINDVMNSIDRPFAYRVSKAIHSYVNAYPNAATSPEAFRNALSDQIEMKVLPKLNGLDITVKKNKDAMVRMGALITNKVKDKQLSETFEKNYRESEVFFKWKGVVR